MLDRAESSRAGARRGLPGGIRWNPGLEGIPRRKDRPRLRALRAVIPVLLLVPVAPARAQPGDPAEAFAATFREDYSVVVEPRDPAAPARASRSFAFKSRVGIPGAAGTTFLRFRLRVDELEDSAAALRALRGLATELRGDLFVKWPLLASSAGPRLYRLDGSCLFAEPQWRAVEQRLLGLLHPAGEPPAGAVLRIACGGAVLASPDGDAGETPTETPGAD